MKRLKRLWFQNTGTVPSAVDLGELYELLKDQHQKKKERKKVGFGIYNQNTKSTWRMIKVEIGVTQRVAECCC